MVGCMCTLHMNVDAKLRVGIFASANEVKMYTIGVSYITVWCFVWFLMGMCEYLIVAHVIIEELGRVDKHMLQ